MAVAVFAESSESRQLIPERCRHAVPGDELASQLHCHRGTIEFIFLDLHRISFDFLIICFLRSNALRSVLTAEVHVSAVGG
jgi:hypothetical protein